MGDWGVCYGCVMGRVEEFTPTPYPEVKGTVAIFDAIASEISEVEGGLEKDKNTPERYPRQDRQHWTFSHFPSIIIFIYYKAKRYYASTSSPSLCGRSGGRSCPNQWPPDTLRSSESCVVGIDDCTSVECSTGTN